MCNIEQKLNELDFLEMVDGPREYSVSVSILRKDEAPKKSEILFYENLKNQIFKNFEALNLELEGLVREIQDQQRQFGIIKSEYERLEREGASEQKKKKFGLESKLRLSPWLNEIKKEEKEFLRSGRVQKRHLASLEGLGFPPNCFGKKFNGKRSDQMFNLKKDGGFINVPNVLGFGKREKPDFKGGKSGYFWSRYG